MTERDAQATFTVESDAKERAKRKLDYGELSERLRQTVHEIAYGTDVTERKRLKEKRRDLRSEVREVNREIEELKERREERQREIDRVDERIDALTDDDGEYDGYLQALETDLHDGSRIDVQHGKVERAAEIGNCDPKDVIQALQERNPDVPSEAFRMAKQHEQPNWKDEVSVQ